MQQFAPPCPSHARSLSRSRGNRQFGVGSVHWFAPVHQVHLVVRGVILQGEGGAQIARPKLRAAYPNCAQIARPKLRTACPNCAQIARAFQSIPDLLFFFIFRPSFQERFSHSCARLAVHPCSCLSGASQHHQTFETPLRAAPIAHPSLYRVDPETSKCIFSATGRICEP